MMQRKGFWMLSIFFLVLLSTLALAAEVSIVASPLTGAPPLAVQFNLTNTTALSTASWDFEGVGKEDSTEFAPLHTFPEQGVYRVKLTATSLEGTVLTAETTISVLAPLSISLTALPSSGTAPLTVQFTAIATGKEPLKYAWDFQGDGIPDSTQQNPLFTFEKAGSYSTTVTVTDGQGQQGSKSASITANAFESKLSLTSYFPTTLIKGENQITVIVSNEGESTLRDLNAKMIGRGLQHLSSSSIGSLKPGDEDSLTLKVNVLETGTLDAQLKIAEKSFPVQFTVAEEIIYNKDELLTQLTVLRQRFDEQERIYTQKKSEGFLVSEVFESMKIVKKQLLDVQQQLLTSKFSEAKINLDIATTSLDDIVKDLDEAQKQKITVLTWLKDNAIALTAIIAAIGTVGGFLVKLKGHAQKVGESVKGKISKKKEMPEQASSPLEPLEEENEKKEE